jgi:hypothetical protein
MSRGTRKKNRRRYRELNENENEMNRVEESWESEIDEDE